MTGAGCAFVSSREELQRLAAATDPYRAGLEAAVLARDENTIWCRACQAIRTARTTFEPPGGKWVNLAEGMACPGCGLNARMRMILKALDAHFRLPSSARALVLEQVTALFPHLRARFPAIVGSEFVPGGHEVGEHVATGMGMVRHDDMMGLSFPDASLDVVMHYDVLEHVPDWKRGLRECRRVLVDEGVLVFTLPFFHTLDRNIVRAEVRDGELVHHLPPGYHGNPMDGAGALVYIHPSWELLDGLHEAGFGRVQMAFCFDPVEGILSNTCPFPDGHTWPIVFFAHPRSGDH